MANNRVYTESVVTLNNQEATARIDELKKKAEELRASMAKLAQEKGINSKEFKAAQKELVSTTKSMNSLNESTKKYERTINNLNGATLNQLQAALKKTQQAMRNAQPDSKEFKAYANTLKDIRTRMRELEGQGRQTQNMFGGFFTKIGWVGMMTGALAAFKKVVSGMISQTQTFGDAWRREVAGWNNLWDTFVASIGSGKGFKEMVADMNEALIVGRKVYDLLDELTEMRNSLTMKEADASDELERNRQIMMDSTYTYQEREAAAQKVIEIETGLANERKAITQQELDANTILLNQRTKMSEADRDFFIRHYNDNRNLIHQAKEYGDNLGLVQKAEQAIYDLRYANPDSDPLGLGKGQRKKEIESWENKLTEARDQIKKTNQEVIEAYGVLQKYNQGNDELIGKWVASYVANEKVESEMLQNTRRAQKTLNAMRKEQADAAVKAVEQQYKDELAATVRHFTELQNKTKEAYAAGRISEQQYQDRLAEIQEESLQARLRVTEKFKKDTISMHEQLLNLAVAEKTKIDKIYKDLLASVESAVKASLDEIDKAIEASVTEEIEEFNRKWKEMWEEAQSIRAELDPASALESQMRDEMDRLQELYDNNLLTEEEFQQKKAEIIRRYSEQNTAVTLETYEKSLQKMQTLISGASSFVDSLQEAATAKSEARMKKELAAAGDNAEERERIEAKYEEEKLAIQKKYADVDMAVKIAETTAAGALAAVQGYAKLGPIAGAIFAGIIAATTAAKIATIVAQRNQIKNASVSGSGSSTTVGERVLTEGYYEGGFTKKASNDYTPVGDVHANEWVAPAAMIRAHPVLFSSLERMRQTGNYHSGVSGYADGGLTGSTGAPIVQMNGPDLSKVVAENNELYRRLLEQLPLKAYVVLSEVNAAGEVEASIKSIVGKKA